MATSDAVVFKTRSRRDDPFGHKTVELNLDDLQRGYNAHVAKFAQGSVTVPQGATSITVTHSMGNPTNSVSITPTIDPGGRFWVSGKSSTAFTINLQVAAPVGGIAFDWLVKGS